jgi:beta-lactamase class A
MRGAALALAAVVLLPAALPAEDSQELGKELARIESEAGGVLGVSAVHLERGIEVGWRSSERFPMMSVYKLPIAIRALAMVESGELGLSMMVRVEPVDLSSGYSPIRDKYPQGTVMTVRQLLEACVIQSDNTASDVLLRLVGGPEAVQASLKLMKLDAIRIDRPEKQINDDLQKMGAKAMDAEGKDSATPRALTTLLSYVQTAKVLQRQNCSVLIRWLTETQTGPKRIKGLLPEGAKVWHKTGTGGTKDGVNLATNDAGVITMPGDQGHIAITIFLKLSTRGEQERELALARAAQAVFNFFTVQASK